MAKRKTGDRVTFVIPQQMLALADVHAEEVGLDRYDVLRSAISKGLLLLRMEQEIAKNPDRYTRDLNDVMRGSELAAASVRGKLEDDVIEGVSNRVNRSDAA